MIELRSSRPASADDELSQDQSCPLSAMGLNPVKNIWFLIFMLLGLAVICVQYQLEYLACIIVAGLLLIILSKNKYGFAALTGLFVFVPAWIFFTVFWDNPGTLDSAGQEVQLTGTIANRPRLADEKCSFVLQPDQSKPNQEKVQVFCYFPARLQKHQKITIRGTLRTPDRAGNPGEFDYASYLYYENIYYIVTVKTSEDLQILGNTSGWMDLLERFRQKSLDMIKEALPPREASIMIGMLLGEVEGINEQEYESYQKTGIVHVFSVSGMHVAFLAMLCGWLLRRLNCSERVVLIISTAVLLLYGTLADWPVPVIRSVTMAVLGLIALYGGRERSLLNSLGLAGAIILLMNPRALFQISFQLSFLAAWGLVYLYPRWRTLASRRNFLIDIILVPAAAQAAILPLIAYYFNMLSPVSLLANLLLGWLSEMVVMIGFIFLLVGVLLAPLGAVMLDLAGLIIKLIRWANPLLLDLPFSYFWVAAPGCASILAYYCGLLLAGGDFNKKARWAGAALIIGFLLVVCMPASWHNRGKMELVFLDVGQGDCMLMKTPYGQFILLDGGGSAMSDVGRRKVLPYLRHRGINQLCLVINTHPDVDHLAGLNAVVDEMPVQAAAVPASIAGDSAYHTFLDKLAQKGVPLIKVNENWTLQEDEWSLSALYAGTESGEKTDLNDQSLVLRCQMGDFSAFLSGDIGRKTLARLDEQMKLNPATVLKIPHHGSKNSLYPPLYQKTRPELAVISVGSRNIFGHPSSPVLKALEGEGITILRTDKCGAVLLRSQGSYYEVFTGPDEKELVMTG